MKKVIVTGATGFVGSWVVRELLRQGVEVIAVVRKNSTNQSALDGLDVRQVLCDLTDMARLPQLVEDRDIDTFYHFAWQGVSDADARDAEIQLSNVRAALDILDAMQVMGIQTFIGAGSLHEAEGIVEMAEHKVVTNLGFMYKAAKTCAHWMAKAKAGAAGIRFFWPIITNAYGEGEQSGRLINTVIRKILTGESPELSEGKQLYDFVHVSDVARAFYLIGEKGIDGANYTIGSGDAKPLRDFLSQVGEIANAVKGAPNIEPIPLQFGAIKSNIVFLSDAFFDSGRLTIDTGYVPQISFDVGVRRTVNWICDKGAFDFNKNI